jgi:hypothetical protein
LNSDNEVPVPAQPLNVINPASAKTPTCRAQIVFSRITIPIAVLTKPAHFTYPV